MANLTTNLEKSVIIGGSEHIRDSDYEEAIAQGVINVGDGLNKGSAETQVVASIELAVNFKGIAIEMMIRASDTSTHATVLTDTERIKILKPMGGRVKVRVMAMGFDSGATVPSGSPVYYNGLGSAIAANDTQLGDFYIDPAQDDGDNASQIGRLAKAAAAPDCSSDSSNVEIEMWY